MYIYKPVRQQQIAIHPHRIYIQFGNVSSELSDSVPPEVVVKLGSSIILRPFSIEGNIYDTRCVDGRGVISDCGGLFERLCVGSGVSFSASGVSDGLKDGICVGLSDGEAVG